MSCVLAIFFMLSVIPVSAAEVAASAPASASTSEPAPESKLVSVAADGIATTPSVVNSVSGAPKSASLPQTTNSATQLASLLGGLVLILLLIYGLSWFVKRFSQGGFMQNPSMKIVAALPLGTRERLLLVEVGGKQLLLGVTATQINNLQVFDAPVDADKSSPHTSDFSQKLMAILQQKTPAAPHSQSPKTPNA